MDVIIKLALKELWSSRRQLIFPFAALSLAVGSLFVLNALQFRIESLLLNEGRATMGADIEIDGQKALGADQWQALKDALPDSTRYTQVTDFNTMMRVPGTAQARFVRAQAVAEGFPFYGEFVIEGSQEFSSLDSAEPSIFIPQSVAEVFEIELGDRVAIGDLTFEVTGLIVKRPGSLGASISFAPSVYFHEKFLDQTRLLERPGRVDYEHLLAVESREPKALVPLVREALNDAQFRVRSFDSEERGFQELFSRFQLFGQIVGLSALLIAAFAIYGSFQNWFRERKFLVAILRSAGASRAQLQIWMWSAVSGLALLATGLGLILGFWGEKFLKPLLDAIVALPDESVPPSLFVVMALVGLVMTFLFSLLAMAEVKNFKPLLLIRPDLENLNIKKERLWVGGLIVLSFFVISRVLTGAWDLAIYLTLGVFVSFVLAFALNALFFRALTRIRARSSFLFQYAVRALKRRWRSSLTSASLLFLISTALALVVALESALQKEFEVDPETPQNTFFVFDMGEGDREELDVFLEAYPALKAYWMPSLTLRWTEWNGRSPYEGVDDDFFDREIRMFVVTELPPANEIVEGKFWQEPHPGDDSPVEVSLAKNYAFLRGIEIGDEMKFSLYGVEFDAVVTSLRAVRFLEFRPNSRYMFQEGFFEDLPYSWFASLETTGPFDRSQFLRDFFAEFTSISLIDLSEVREDLVSIIERLRQGIFFILMFLVVVSLALIAAFAREKLTERKREIALLKCVGAKLSQIVRLVVMEFAFLSLLPSVIGVALGVGAAKILLTQVFAIHQTPISWPLMAIPIGTLILVELVALILSGRLFSVKARLLFAEA